MFTASPMVHDSRPKGTSYLSHGMWEPCYRRVFNTYMSRSFQKPYDGRSVLLTPRRLLVYPTLPSPWYQQFVNCFMASPFLGPIPLLAVMYGENHCHNQLAFPKHVWVSSLSKVHHNLGQRPHRLLSRMESGLFYCANRGLLRFIAL